MTQFLPPNLLALFAPRDPIPYKTPTQPLTWEKDREKSPYLGIGHLVQLFEDPKDTPPPTRGEKKAEKKKRRIREKAEQRSLEIVEEVKAWDPHNDPNATGDAFKTLFIGRMNYDTTESKLRREFEPFGKIRKVHVVTNKATGRPRGYAFIEFEKEHDMHAAYKSADGKKIDGRRVLVDVERGRTVKGWRPRRLGGGLGSTRAAPDDEGRTRERGERDRDRDRDRRPAERERNDRDRDRERRERRSPERPKERERRHRSRERERDRDRPRDRDRDRDRDKRRDKDRDRRDRDRDRDRDRKRDGERRSRKDDAGDGDAKKEDRSRDSRHRHRERSRERDGRRERDRHRDKSDAKMESVKQEGAGEYNENRPPPSNQDGNFYDGPGGDGMNQEQAAVDNGYYQENMKFKEEIMEQQPFESMELKQEYEE